MDTVPYELKQKFPVGSKIRYIGMIEYQRQTYTVTGYRMEDVWRVRAVGDNQPLMVFRPEDIEIADQYQEGIRQLLQWF